ncbi:MAG: autotransporter domain-containing protein [Verrucomicrobiae bacterium]|nr:autotransporter domain-containing protein [Verrucomicrobiae bacterium]
MKFFKFLSTLFAAVFMAASAQASSCDSGVTTAKGTPSSPEIESVNTRTSANNPTSPINVAAEQSIMQSLSFALGTPKTHAGVPKSDFNAGISPNSGNEGAKGDGKNPGNPIKGSSWFSNPYVFTEYGYSSNKDTRIGGYNSDIQSGIIGGGFTTAWDLMVGGMMIYNNSDGAAVNNGHAKSDVYTGSIYFSRAIINWLYWNASFSYSHADNTTSSNSMADTDSETGSWSIAPSLTAFKQIDSWTLSTTPTYIASLQNYAYSGFSDDTGYNGKFVLMNRVAYAFNDFFTAALLLNPNYITNDHPADGVGSSAGKAWLNTGLRFNFRLADGLDLYTGYTYDAFNNTYINHNFNLGVNYSF